MEKTIIIIRETNNPINYLFITDKEVYDMNNILDNLCSEFDIDRIDNIKTTKTSNLILIETGGGDIPGNILIEELYTNSSLEFKKAIINEIRSARVIDSLIKKKGLIREYKSLGNAYASLRIEDIYSLGELYTSSVEDLCHNDTDLEEKICNKLLDKLGNTSEKRGGALSIFNPNTEEFIVKPSEGTFFKIIKF